ncbi:AfsR/SARP family transcriptional regulator [Actinomadura opuntiae]|uniref:AfsR/SARP family transcriptional regulator n=1 Tax=Actinomadura sp. OS1-43 TaxID=604315 RepID=UPI00255A90CD|nr:AfsR/SARP family transcriptional regulator [Actinomadura sp. OS1-43]MDL4815557.1 AfsR/SARP family transcriptional regulator [Actinomadura sp. OS1-43]
MDGVGLKVLGPLEAVVDGRRVELPKGGQRVLLAALALNAGQVVPVEHLLDHMWGDRLPDRPRGALYSCVSRLRQWLDRHSPGSAELLTTSSGGYVLELGPGRLDLLRFRALTREAAAAGERGDLAAQSAVLREALALWRGPVLANVRSDTLQQTEVPRLTEEYLRAVERRCEVGLELGEHDGMVGELRALTDRYPFRERFWWQLMLALSRSGRRVEALAAYRKVSSQLRDEFGVDPDLELRRLQMAILRDDHSVLSL